MNCKARICTEIYDKVLKTVNTLTISYSSVALNGTYIHIRVAGWKHNPVWAQFLQALGHSKQGSASTGI